LDWVCIGPGVFGVESTAGGFRAAVVDGRRRFGTGCVEHGPHRLVFGYVQVAKALL
jgi:hypothetical protein